MNIFLDLVRGIRNTRTEYNVDPGKRISAIVNAGSHADDVSTYGYIFRRLCNVEDISLLSDAGSQPENSASVVAGGVTLYLPLEGMLDIEVECKRLTSEKEKITQSMTKSENMLSNEKFVSNARPDVVQKERDRLAELQASVAQIEERLASLCG